MVGTTILLPRGTQVNGTIEHGLTTGEDRLFLVWTDALTPRPGLLAIPLDSPASDELGQTGVPGDIDDHGVLDVDCVLRRPVSLGPAG